VHYRQNGRVFLGLAGSWQGHQKLISADSKYGTWRHGDSDLCPPEDAGGVSYELTFGIVQEIPLVVWKLKLFNHGASPIQVERVDLLVVDPALEGSRIVFPGAKKPAEMGFFHNGWQSWSPVGWVAGDGKMPRTRLGGMQAPMIYNTGTPRPGGRGHFSSDFFFCSG